MQAKKKTWNEILVEILIWRIGGCTRTAKSNLPMQNTSLTAAIIDAYPQAATRDQSAKYDPPILEEEN